MAQSLLAHAQRANRYISRVPMAGLEPARAYYGPTDFKSVASAISPHRRILILKLLRYG